MTTESSTTIRRLSVLLATLVAALGLASTATAGRNATPAGSHSHGASLLDWQERWFGWVGGSSTDPFETGVCGERVGKLFFLTAALGPGTEVECHLRTGVPLLASPGGVFAWANDSVSDEQLLADRDGAMATVSNPTAVLDGRELEVDSSLRLSGVYTIPLEPGNLIENVDPTVTGDSVRLASGGWFLRLPPLRPGDHELFLSVEFDDGTGADITFHIVVHGGGRAGHAR